jgi:hypothetical protein
LTDGFNPQTKTMLRRPFESAQYLSIKYTEAGIEPSVGSIGDSYDNALAETVYYAQLEMTRIAADVHCAPGARCSSSGRKETSCPTISRPSSGPGERAHRIRGPMADG